jgi:hypothetical protein
LSAVAGDLFLRLLFSTRASAPVELTFLADDGMMGAKTTLLCVQPCLSCALLSHFSFSLSLSPCLPAFPAVAARVNCIEKEIFSPKSETVHWYDTYACPNSALDRKEKGNQEQRSHNLGEA